MVRFESWGYLDDHTMYGDAYIEARVTLTRGDWNIQTETLRVEDDTLLHWEQTVMAKGFVVLNRDYKSGKLKLGQKRWVVWG